MRPIEFEQIQLEAESGYRPYALDPSYTPLPFSELGDREFELFSYLLIKEEIDCEEHESYDNVSLMQGVGERGRDCVVYKDGDVAAIIQCKKYKSRVTKPSFLKELIKLLLHAYKDKSIIPKSGKIKYLFYISSDLTEPAITLTNKFSDEIKNEISSGLIKNLVEQVVSEYESFSLYDKKEPLEDIYKLFKRVEVNVSNGVDLTNRVLKKSKILEQFFKVKTVIDLESNDLVIRTALEDYGLKLITDSDLKSIQKRVGSSKDKHRINLGWVDFFGFDEEFFKYLKGEKFKELLASVMAVNTKSNKYLFDFLSEKINELVYEKVTVALINSGLIHPYSVNIVTAYLIRRISKPINSNVLPKNIHRKSYPENFLSKDELIHLVFQDLLHSSEKYLQGDYSDIKGTPDELRFKLEILFPHIHQGFNDATDIKDQVDKDLIVLSPVIDNLEELLEQLFASTRTIVIKGGDYMDDDDALAKIKKTLESLQK